MDFRAFLLWERSSRDTIDFKKIYVDIAGELVPGLILSQIIYWFLPNKKGEPKATIVHDGHTWIAKKNDSWWDECRVKERTAMRAIAYLCEKKLIITEVFKFNGYPTVHIRINHDAFMTAWETQIQQTTELEPDSILPDWQNGYCQIGKILCNTDYSRNYNTDIVVAKTRRQRV